MRLVLQAPAPRRGAPRTRHTAAPRAQADSWILLAATVFIVLLFFGIYKAGSALLDRLSR